MEEQDRSAQKGEESQLLIHQVQGPTMRCPMPTKLHTGTGPPVQKDGNQRIRETQANSGMTTERPFMESCKQQIRESYRGLEEICETPPPGRNAAGGSEAPPPSHGAN
jgi:hypothetical protein